MTVKYTTDIDFIGTSPAGIDRTDPENPVLYINPPVFDNLTPFQQKFIVEHEKGHWKLDTDSEIEADGYAFDQLAGTEFKSLKQCLKCINEIVTPENPQYKSRYDALYIRALKWDYANGNQEAGKELQKLNIDLFMGRNLNDYNADFENAIVSMLNRNSRQIDVNLNVPPKEAREDICVLQNADVPIFKIGHIEVCQRHLEITKIALAFLGIVLLISILSKK